MEMNLSNHFLIAMPGMSDNNFVETLTLICEHNADGALGFIVNKPTQVAPSLRPINHVLR